MRKHHWLYVIAALSGIAVWAAISGISNKKEAWDSPLYFSAGLPALCLTALVLAIVEPKRPWRWALIPMAAQALWMFVLQGIGNMAPLGLIFFAILAVPALIAAQIGAFFGRRRQKEPSS